MAEKNAFAQLLDKMAESKKNRSAEKTEDFNILPKPNSQELKDGYILWTWKLNDGFVVESILATRHNNEAGLEKGKYVVNVKMPQTESCTYSFFDNMAKDFGKAILSAWNWKEIWKLHAGDFLLAELSDDEPEPQVEVEVSTSSESQTTSNVDFNVRPPELFVPTRTAPSFDNGRLEP